MSDIQRLVELWKQHRDREIPRPVEERLKEAAADQRLDITTRALLSEAAEKVDFDKRTMKHQLHVVRCREKTEQDTRDECSKKIGELRGQMALLREATAGHKKGLERALLREKRAKQTPYTERNRLVALLTTKFHAGVAVTAIEGWDKEWHNCVYIDFPWGQASWHYHDRDAHLFSHLPPYEEEWDGHTTQEKYAAIESHTKSYKIFSVLGTDEVQCWRRRAGGGEHDTLESAVEACKAMADDDNFGFPVIVAQSLNGPELHRESPR